jgi:hypothetical protein
MQEYWAAIFTKDDTKFYGFGPSHSECLEDLQKKLKEHHAARHEEHSADSPDSNTGDR